MKKLLVLFAFIACGALAQAAAPNDADTVWFRWYHQIDDVCWSPDDSTIAAFNSSDKELCFINTITGEKKKTISCPGGWHNQWSKDGKYILSNLQQGVEKYPVLPYVIDTKTYARINTFENPGTPSEVYSISPDNKVCAYGNEYKYLRIWDIGTGKLLKNKDIGTDLDENNDRTMLIFSSFTNDGKYILIKTARVHYDPPTQKLTTLSANLYLYDTLNLEPIKEFTDQYGDYTVGIPNIIPSKTGKYFFSYTYESHGKAARITDVETGEVVLVVDGDPSTIPDVDFSSDDRYIAFPRNGITGTEEIEVWDIINKQMVYTYKRNPQSIFNYVGFSNNNKYIIGGSSGKIFLYKTNSFLSTESDNKIQATITYPNPAHSTITLDFALSNPGNTEISIIDLSGNTVKSITKEFLDIGSHSFTIDLAAIPNGTYFIKIVSDGSVSVNKFIVNN